MNILNIGIGVPDSSAKWWNIKGRVNYLRSAGHDVDVLCYYNQDEVDLGLELDGVYFVRASTISSPVSHLKNSFLRDKEYDCIYGNNHLAAFIGTTEKIRRTPLIFHIHGDIVHERILKSRHGDGYPSLYQPANLTKIGLSKGLEIVATNLSDRIVCVSRTMKEHMHNRGVDSEKLCYIPNPVDLEYFSPIERDEERFAEQFPNPNNRVFGYIGGFQAWQGVDNLEKAVDIIDENEANFIFVGGPEKEEKNALYEGWVERDRVREYYSQCDILVLPRPSHKVTEIAAPTKFAEYAAMGKPILASQVGDAGKLIREYNCGIVVEDNSLESIAEGISSFIQLPQKELDSMGENARKLAEEEFSWKKIGPKLSQIVQDVTRQRTHVD